MLWACYLPFFCCLRSLRVSGLAYMLDFIGTRSLAMSFIFSRKSAYAISRTLTRFSIVLLHSLIFGFLNELFDFVATARDSDEYA